MKKAGFTLIELVVVLIVLSLGLTTLLLMLRQATYNNTTSQYLTIACDLAQERIEQIISDRKNPLRGFSYIVNANYPAESPVTDFSTYSRSVNIYYVDLGALNTPAAGSTNYKRVAVTISGPGGGDVTLVTLVTDY